MDTRDQRLLLYELLTAHNVPATMTDDGILVGATSVWRALVFDHHITDTVQVQLDIVVEGDPRFESALLIESFVGIGATRPEAIAQAFDKFCRASFHVLLGVLVDPMLGGDQVEWEQWIDSHSTWTICMGGVTIQARGDAPPFEMFRFGELVDTLREAWVATAPKTAIQWFRMYYMGNAGAMVGSEALLNSEPWPAGQAILNQWDWPVTPTWYSIRHFWMAQATLQGEDRSA